MDELQRGGVRATAWLAPSQQQYCASCKQSKKLLSFCYYCGKLSSHLAPSQSVVVSGRGISDDLLVSKDADLPVPFHNRHSFVEEVNLSSSTGSNLGYILPSRNRGLLTGHSVEENDDLAVRCKKAAIRGLQRFHELSKDEKFFDINGGDMLFLCRNLALSTSGMVQHLAKSTFQNLYCRWSRRAHFHVSCEDILERNGCEYVIEGLQVVISIQRRNSKESRIFSGLFEVESESRKLQHEVAVPSRKRPRLETCNREDDGEEDSLIPLTSVLPVISFKPPRADVMPRKEFRSRLFKASWESSLVISESGSSGDGGDASETRPSSVGMTTNSEKSSSHSVDPVNYDSASGGSTPSLELMTRKSPFELAVLSDNESRHSVDLRDGIALEIVSSQTQAFDLRWDNCDNLEEFACAGSKAPIGNDLLSCGKDGVKRNADDILAAVNSGGYFGKSDGIQEDRVENFLESRLDSYFYSGGYDPTSERIFTRSSREKGKFQGQQAPLDKDQSDQFALDANKLITIISRHLRGFDVTDVLGFDPKSNRVPMTSANHCGNCGEIRRHGELVRGERQRCPNCAFLIRSSVDYGALTDALVKLYIHKDCGIDSTFHGGRRVHIRSVLGLLPLVRQYESMDAIGTNFFKLQSYFVTHLLYVFSDWGKHSLRRYLFEPEFEFLIKYLPEVIRLKDIELVGEFVHCLRILQIPGISEANFINSIRKGCEFLLKKESEGNWPYTKAHGALQHYNRYHTIYCAIVGLIEPGFDNEGSIPRILKMALE